MTDSDTNVELDPLPVMPSVPAAVWISLVTAVLGVAAALGLPISQELSTAVIALTGVLVTIIPIVDLRLRRARIELFVARASAVANPAVIVNNAHMEEGN